MMRFFKHLPIFLGIVGCLSLDAKPQSDKLIAFVEKNAITEQDVFERYQILKKTSPQTPALHSIRGLIIDDICAEKVIDDAWSKFQLPDIQIDPQRLQGYKEHFALDNVSNKALEAFHKKHAKMRNIMEYLAAREIQVSNDEIQHMLRQHNFWQQVNALWSFKILYHHAPISEELASEESKVFSHYPAARVSKELMEQIDWQKIKSWQFFTTDDEYVAFYLDEINVPDLLKEVYTVNVLQVASDTPPTEDVIKEIFAKKSIKPELGRFIQSDEIRLTSQIPNEIIINELSLLEPMAWTQPTQLGNSWIVIQLIDKKDQDFNATVQHIQDEARHYLSMKKAEEKFPAWLAEQKAKLYIKVLEQ